MNKLLIVPDVHGRTNWEQAVERTSFDKVVFLGDYLAPYPFDMVYYNISKSGSIENFKNILAYKRKNEDKTILLIGNHDCTYLYGRNVCDSRNDNERFDEIQELYRKNRNLFQMAWETTMRKQRYVFSHAGISIGWMDRYAKGWTTENMVAMLNQMNADALSEPEPENTPFANALAIRGKNRSSDEDYASPVWMDAELLHESPQLPGLIQVVGHTQRISWCPVFTPTVIYTDCGGNTFILNDYGTIRDMNGKICKNEDKDPFNPEGSHPGIGFDCFERPYCRKCGSRDIFVRAGMMANTYSCNNCGVKEYR